MHREGLKVRAARRRRRCSQRELGARVGIAQTTISKIERGDGASLAVATWQRVANELQLPLRLELGRDRLEEPTDVGHLAVQELVLRLGREGGYSRRFELSTKPSQPALSADVGLIDHARHRLLLIECVNVFGDIGAASRSSDRKMKEAEDLAITLGHGAPYSVHCCWVVRDTNRNRELLARYPEIFSARFSGSSRQWAAALADGSEPPAERGLVWADGHAIRVYPWRRRS